jgi:hypothetical protein
MSKLVHSYWVKSGDIRDEVYGTDYYGIGAEWALVFGIASDGRA